MPHILKAGPTVIKGNMDIWNTSKMQPYTAIILHVSKVGTVTESWYHQITHRGHLTMDKFHKALTKLMSADSFNTIVITASITQ